MDGGIASLFHAGRARLAATERRRWGHRSDKMQMSEQQKKGIILVLAESFTAVTHALIEGAKSRPDEATVDPRDEPLIKILLHCAELSRGCTDVGRGCNATALAILARALLENFILALWITKSEENALSLEHEAVAELARIARVNLKAGKLKILNKETGEDASTRFLDTDRFKNLPKRMSVEARAREANVLDLYNVFYRFLSMDIHGHGERITSNEFYLDLATMHLQGIGALLKAIECTGRMWLKDRRCPDNEELRSILGLGNWGTSIKL